MLSSGDFKSSATNWYLVSSLYEMFQYTEIYIYIYIGCPAFIITWKHVTFYYLFLIFQKHKEFNNKVYLAQINCIRLL